MRGQQPVRHRAGLAWLRWPIVQPVRETACAACGGFELCPHWRVAGEVGAQGLIPTTDRFGTALSDVVRCGRCGHMQLERFPSDAQLAEAYARAESQDYVAEEPGQRATARMTLA